MRIFFLVLHVFIALAMIAVILLQKGEDVNANQGGGYNPGSGGRGRKNVLTRTTAILATVFIANCILLANLVRRESRLSTDVPVAPAHIQQPVKR